jgi:hypothetical protein
VSIDTASRKAHICKTQGTPFDLTFCYVVPSQASIYQHMLSQESTFSNTEVPKSAIAAFLNEGIGIQDSQ